MDEIFISLDLETTGLDPLSDEIIEVGAVKFCGAEVLDTFNTMVKPHGALPYRIQVLTGIAPEDLQDAPPLELVLGDLESFLGDHPIIGQRIAFDLAFLAERGISPRGRVYDVFELAIILLPTLPDYRLAAIAESLGISSPAYHRALHDANTAREVFLALLNAVQVLDPPVAAELERLCAAVDWDFHRLIHGAREESAAHRSAGSGGLTLRVSTQPREKDRRLAPLLVRRPLDIEEMSRMLDGGGLLSQTIPQFEHRPEQVSMMRAVAETMNSGGHLVVEAGTGTGKSMAYLLPAMFFAVENGVPVVISTNTLNLQEQLMHKDIPALAEALGQRSLRCAQLKGRGNYICMRRWDSLRRAQLLSVEEVKFMARTLVWLTATVTGDRSEVSLRGDEIAMWDRVCAKAENCLGGHCAYQKRGECFLYRARRGANGVHLIVVNHALLLSDLVGGNSILPEYRHLIIDEAHRLEDEATEQWGFEVGERELLGYLSRLGEAAGQREGRGGILFELSDHFRGSSVPRSRQQEVLVLAQGVVEGVERTRGRVAELLDAVLHFMSENVEDRGEYERRMRITGVERRDPAWRRIALAAEDLCLSLGEIGAGLDRLHTALEPLCDLLEYESLMLEISSAVQHAAELSSRVESIVCGQEGGGDEKVCWLSLKGDVLTLCAAPLHVGPVLRDSLFSQKECVVLTSATLSTGGNFEYIKGRLSLEDAGELLLGSSFDYKRAALVYIPEDIPEPGQPGYQQAVSQALVELCRITGGRTLALFTSHASLRATHEVVQTALQDDDILVLGQGVDGSPRQLLQVLKSNPRVVLLGTASFWEGVDVAGGALSVLAIMRLPFNVPSDPIFIARSGLFDSPFDEYAVPQAVLRFKQGFGRLIRTRNDRGAIVVLDRRLKSKSYGAVFLKSLPPCEFRSGPVRQLPDEVSEWLSS